MNLSKFFHSRRLVQRAKMVAEWTVQVMVLAAWSKCGSFGNIAHSGSSRERVGRRKELLFLTPFA
jgi:hypothetical protein